MTDSASVAVRLNPFKQPDAGLPILEGSRQVPWSPYGRILEERPIFTLHPLFHAGCYYVQDSSAMYVGHVFRKLLSRSFEGAAGGALQGETSRQTFDKLVGKISDALSEVKGMSEAERRKAVSDAIARFGPEYGVTVDSEKAAAFAEKALAVLGEKDPAAITPWEYITALAGAASVLQD